MRGLSFLGAAATITPDQAFQQAIQITGFGPRNPRDFANQTWLNKVYAQIQAGQFDTAWVSPHCVGIIAKNSGARDLTLTQAIGTAASTATGIAAMATGGTPAAIAAGTASAVGTALGIATLGIGIVVTIVSIIFAHHAAAVAQEQNIECTGTNAANNSMNVLAEGVQSGQIAPADAVKALDTLYANYAQMVKPSFGTSPWCNANCELQIVLKAMVIYWQAQYQAMADAAAAQAAQAVQNPAGAAQSAVQNVATSTGLPTWAIWLLGAWALYELI
jgi:hypothetical protein